LGRGSHPMGHLPDTLTNESTPLGRKSPFKGHGSFPCGNWTKFTLATKNSYTSEVNVVAGKCGMLAGKQARMHYVVSERQLGLDGYQHKWHIVKGAPCGLRPWITGRKLLGTVGDYYSGRHSCKRQQYFDHIVSLEVGTGLNGRKWFFGGPEGWEANQRL